MKKRICILGVAGFIGSNLAEVLQRDFEVYGIDNFSTGKKENLKGIKAKIYKADLTDTKKTIELFYKIKPEYIFHMAALPRIQLSLDQPVETFKANVLITQNALEASRLVGVKKFIYSSSSSVYGDQKIPLNEKMTPKPISLYAMQKYFGEVLCQKYTEFYGLPTVCLRYFNVYGKKMDLQGAYKLVIAVWLEQLKQGKPITIYGDGKQTRDFTYVKDVVWANIRTMFVDIQGIYNIGSGKETSMNKLADLVGGKREYIKNPRPYEEMRKRADIRKAKNKLGYKPFYNIEEGLRDAGYIK